MENGPEMEQPWHYTVVHGGEHPDNKPPVTIVSEATDEAVAKEEAAVNAALAKDHEVVVETKDAKAGGAKVESENLDDHTVAELKEIAAAKGVELNWDDNKTEIIKKIKKAK